MLVVREEIPTEYSLVKTACTSNLTVFLSHVLPEKKKKKKKKKITEEHTY